MPQQLRAVAAYAMLNEIGRTLPQAWGLDDFCNYQPRKRKLTDTSHVIGPLSEHLLSADNNTPSLCCRTSSERRGSSRDIGRNIQHAVRDPRLKNSTSFTLFFRSQNNHSGPFNACLADTFQISFCQFPSWPPVIYFTHKTSAIFFSKPDVRLTCQYMASGPSHWSLDPCSQN